MVLIPSRYLLKRIGLMECTYPNCSTTGQMPSQQKSLDCFFFCLQSLCDLSLLWKLASTRFRFYDKLPSTDTAKSRFVQSFLQNFRRQEGHRGKISPSFVNIQVWHLHNTIFHWKSRHAQKHMVAIATLIWRYIRMVRDQNQKVFFTWSDGRSSKIFSLILTQGQKQWWVELTATNFSS